MCKKYERTYTLAEYINNKIRMLQDEFKIRLAKEDIDYLKNLKSETAVDNAAKARIYRHLNKQDLYRERRKNK